MKDGILIGLILAGGAGAAILLARRQEQGGGGGGGYAGGGGAADYSGGLESGSYIDPISGLPINPVTGLPDPNMGTGGAGTGGAGSGPVLDLRLSPEVEAAILKNTEDTNRQIQGDNEATNQAVRDAANQQASDSALSRNVNIAVGAGLLAASYKGIASFGRGLISGAAGLGRSVPAIARAAAISPAAPIVGGALQGGLSIVQGAQDLQARNQGQGPYAHIQNDAAAVTAATANTAAATAVGAGSLGLASLDFNKGVHFLGLPVVTKASGHRVRLFGQSWLEF